MGFNTKTQNNYSKLSKSYLINDKSTRMNFLAGFLDSNGFITQKKFDSQFCYEINFVYDQIPQNIPISIKNIQFLVRSLGFAIYSKETSLNEGGYCYSLQIFGEKIDSIPVKLLDRQVFSSQSNCKYDYDTLTSDFTIDYIGYGDYYGFELDGNGRFLLGDFTVTHNSNFFHAIRFVICDLFHQMNQIEKNDLLHEGAGYSAVSAYVEIVFDNKDRRFPIDLDEFSLRRSIDLKKDDYFLNQKHISKNEAISFLESAGFSQSNTYYIVQQGKVNSLATMKDQERLELFKEISGVQIYEEKRTESLSMNKQAEQKRQKIQETLENIEQRIKELESENQELHEYQKLDRKKRSLEYAIFQRELEYIQKKLNTLDKRQQSEQKETSEFYLKAEHGKQKIKDLQYKIKTLQTEVDGLERKIRDSRTNREDLIKEKVMVELDVNELDKRIAFENERKKETQQKLTAIRSELEQASKKLSEIVPKFENVDQEEKNLKQQLNSFQHEISSLQMKLSGKSQFSNKKERDQWIKKETNKISEIIETQTNQLENLNKENQQFKNQLQDQTTQSKMIQNTISERRTRIEEMEKTIKELIQKRNEQTDQRKELWIQKEKIEQELIKSSNDFTKNKTQLYSTMSKVLSSGLQEVERIAREESLLVHGPLIELFHCDEAYFTAIEVASGNSLFHIVVDSDQITTQILNKMKTGRVSFLPLNRLQNYPVEPIDTSDAKNMMDVLEFDPKFQKAFEHTFSKHLICKDLETAMDYSKRFGKNCITLDGDQVLRKGALTGGFHDKRKSRLKSMQSIKSCRENVQNYQQKHQEVVAQIEEIDQEITQTLSEIHKIQTQQAQETATLKHTEMELNTIQSSILNLNNTISSKSAQIEKLEMNVNQMKEKSKSLLAEIDSEMSEKLNSQEKNKMEELQSKLTEFEEKAKSIKKKRMQFQTEKTKIENRKTFLTKQKQLLKADQPTDLQSLSNDLSREAANLERIKQALEQETLQLKENEKQVELTKEKIKKQTKKLNQIQDLQQLQYQQDLEDSGQSDRIISKRIALLKMEKIMNKRSTLNKKKEDCLNNIRELGFLPSKDFEKLKEKPQKQLMEMFEKCNKKLQGYQHVNKKAHHQYLSFMDKRKELVHQKKKLDQEYESIETLISDLDQKKDEAIKRSIEIINNQFQEIFNELVPNGKAFLIMQRKDIEKEEQDNEVSKKSGIEDISSTSDQTIPNEPTATLKQYFGIGIRVTFDKESKALKNLEELSGGQKALVALSLLLAIQRADPAPFYLFDEIDSALDPGRRRDVSFLIQKMSENAQVITSTFKPELIGIGDQFFHVSYKNRVSVISSISKDQAIQIISQTQK
ncbi:structural maintenance of chromosomes protein [Anaeramoeba ignava]|uniref:Structural maintenance of chromosomes protein n=1 Tax=Anaeramoeba ignava TaxID=1746090 RepID=A0A9Q0R3X9_ANAIG|nr:structural maintenance of chromosomes protein [Anaeramoeba ignava]